MIVLEKIDEAIHDLSGKFFVYECIICPTNDILWGIGQQQISFCDCGEWVVIKNKVGVTPRLSGIDILNLRRELNK